MTGYREEKVRLLRENTPILLRNLKIWVCAINKVPYIANLQKPPKTAKSNDPKTWRSFDEALECLAAPNSPFDDIEFMVSNGILVVDIDKTAIKNGHLSDEACAVYNLLNSYSEYSKSGTGSHTIILATKPGPNCKKSGFGGPEGDIELYDHARAMVMKGRPIPGFNMPVEERQAEVETLYYRLWPKTGKPKPESAASQMDLSDTELCTKICSSKEGPKFKRLFHDGDITGYPSQSEAWFALLGILAFWTNRNADRMDRLFRQSALYTSADEKHRKKWERLGSREIERAILGTSEGYKPKQRRSTKPSSAKAEEETPVSKEEALSRHLTDTGNAILMADRNAGKVHYCCRESLFYIWDGRRHAPDTKHAIVRIATDTILSMYPEASDPEKTKEERRELTQFALRCESRRSIEAMVELLKARPGIAVDLDEFDENQWLLNTQTGLLDLQTGKEGPHRAETLCRKITGCGYDRNAECPRFLSFLEEIFEGNPDVINFLQRCAGYTLTGSVQEDKFFILCGSGRNGKSVLVSTFMSLFGSYSSVSDSRTFLLRDRFENSNAPREDLAALCGLRATFTSETAGGRKLDVNLLKTITGQDALRVRKLRENSFVFTPTFKLWFSTNNLPQIGETSRAIWDRIVLIPFARYFAPEERDPNLRAKLQEELPGILAWMVQGCLAWQREGLNAPKQITAACRSYEEEEDVLRDFIDESCQFGINARVKVRDLFAAYETWCSQHNERPLGKRGFHDRLISRGGLRTMKGAKNVSIWCGD